MTDEIVKKKRGRPKGWRKKKIEKDDKDQPYDPAIGV
jgi:hypothetical protein